VVRRQWFPHPTFQMRVAALLDLDASIVAGWTGQPVEWKRAAVQFGVLVDNGNRRSSAVDHRCYSTLL